MQTVFSKGGETVGYPYREQVFQITTYHTNKNVNSRFIKKSDVKIKAKNPFEDNVRECLHDFRVKNNLLNNPLKNANCKAKILY